MKLLVDTQTFLRWLATPTRLNQEVTALLENPQVDCYFSTASAWEVAIKYAIGKLPLPHPPEKYLLEGVSQGGFLSLPVELTHTVRVATLPPHHKDPFDRLLICQAQAEGLTIVTSDPVFALYDVTVIRSD